MCPPPLGCFAMTFYIPFRVHLCISSMSDNITIHLGTHIPKYRGFLIHTPYTLFSNQLKYMPAVAFQAPRLNTLNVSYAFAQNTLSLNFYLHSSTILLFFSRVLFMFLYVFASITYSRSPLDQLWTLFPLLTNSTKKSLCFFLSSITFLLSFCFSSFFCL